MKKLALVSLILTTLVNFCCAQKNRHTFALGDSTFLLDKKPFQIISGEMHCTRIPYAY